MPGKTRSTEITSGVLNPLSGLTFDDWIEHGFAHPAPPAAGQEWFWNIHAPYWWPEGAEAIVHVTRLFREGGALLRRFDDAQVAQGLTYLFSTSANGDMPFYRDRAVPAATRAACVAGLPVFFAEVITPRCKPVLGHKATSETWEPRSVNSVAYMWFDVAPAFFEKGVAGEEVVWQAELAAMEAILALDHPACQEAALHGLGHAHYHFPEDTAPVVERYLRRGVFPLPDLETYARAALCGCVQ